MLSSIDLFSGLGGISHSLRGFVKPMCYCDIDPMCRSTLEARITTGDLPHAPVLRDVRDTRSIMAAIRGRKVDMIISSSSCVGFSIIGARNGLGHAETRLFWDVLDLVRTLKVPMVFMENVRAILTSNSGQDYRAILKQFANMGYRVTWCVLTAEHVGGWHRRSRWFALAYKPKFLQGRCLRMPNSLPDIRRYRWTQSSKPNERLPLPGTRCVGRDDVVSRRSHRMKMLGNAVVPDCVRLAFMYLYSGGKQTDIRCRNLRHSEFELQRVKRSIRIPCVTQFPTFGSSRLPGGRSFAHVAGALKYESIDLRIRIDPSRGVGGNRALARRNKRRMMMKRYMTPRAQNNGHCNAATYRCLGDLGTQTRFMKGVAHPDGQLNPRFVEFLMGFPKDWSVAIGRHK